MSWLVSFERCTDEDRLRHRREWFAILTLGFLALVVWNPVDRPGPVLCLLRNSVGLPCPLCGCTRGVALGMRGELFEASTYNILAIPALAVLVFLWLKYGLELAYSRHLRFFGGMGAGPLLKWVVPVLMLVGWIYVLTYRREEEFALSWVGRLLEFVRRLIG